MEPEQQQVPQWLMDEGIVKLPENTKIKKVDLDSEEVRQMSVADWTLISSVTAFCGQEIASKHQKTSAVIGITRTELEQVPLTCYTVYVRMPAEVRINADQVTEIILINIHRVTRVEWGYSARTQSVEMEIDVDSHANPINLEHYTTNTTSYRRARGRNLVRFSAPTDDDERGSLKRNRTTR